MDFSNPSKPTHSNKIMPNKHSKLRPDWTIDKGTQTYPEIQPQVVQLELLYNAPLIKDAMVERFEDLLLLKNKYHYQHKRIWVKEQAAEYYLDNGDGTQATNWKKSIGRMIVQQWSEHEVYQEGDVVVLNLKLYYALKDVEPGNSPLSNEDLWGVVTGEIETYRYTFQNVSSVIIYTEIKNPIFQIIKGNLVTDASGEPVFDEETGFQKLDNQEFIGAQVIFRHDLQAKNGKKLPDNEGGNPYEIKFFENEEPALLSGVITVK